MGFRASRSGCGPGESPLGAVVGGAGLLAVGAATDGVGNLAGSDAVPVDAAGGAEPQSRLHS